MSEYFQNPNPAALKAETDAIETQYDEGLLSLNKRIFALMLAQMTHGTLETFEAFCEYAANELFAHDEERDLTDLENSRVQETAYAKDLAKQQELEDRESFGDLADEAHWHFNQGR